MIYVYVGVGLLSAAALILELTLTRIFSVAQWYHFAFLSVSVALLGFGASGSMLTLFPSRDPRRNRLHLLSGACILFSCSTVGSYMTINYLPFDSYRIAWEGIQLVYLASHYVALITPFFFAGLVMGILLSTYPSGVHRLYAANMVGSAAGSLAALGLLSLVGGAGTVAIVALAGLLAGVSFHRWGASRVRGTPSSVLGAVRSAALALCCIGLIVLAIRPPQWWRIRTSPYKTLSVALRFPDARVAFQKWNSFSRVDVVESQGIHSAPGLSLAYTGGLPLQLGLTVDGGNLSPISRRLSPADEGFLDHLPSAIGYALRPKANTLILEPHGGLNVSLALRLKAEPVTVVDSNPLIPRLLRDRYATFTGGLYRDPRVRLRSEGGRSYVRRSRESYDIIHVSLSDTFRPITSGAYSLSENYLYTVDAFVDYLSHLAPRGVLMVSRWLQDPPSEELRLVGLAMEGLARLRVPEPDRCLVAIRSWSTMLLLVSREPFTPSDIERIVRFCEQRNFDTVYYPGISREDANRYNLMEEPVYYELISELIASPDPTRFYRNYSYDVSPVTDDRPFFFHFFRWGQVPDILRSYGRAWQPFGGAGYLVLVVLLLLALVVSIALVLLPLVLRGQRAHGHKRLLLYFSLLGIGYLFVEIPLMQQFILYLGQPTHAFAVVLFAILLYSGIGSYLSPRVSPRFVLPGLAVLILVYPAVLTLIFTRTLGAAIGVRLTIAVLSLGPLGLLMGMPFPQGIARVNQASPKLIPWAWAVNGCASVISSILAAMLSISFGFTTVVIIAAVTYGAAWLVLIRE